MNVIKCEIISSTEGEMEEESAGRVKRNYRFKRNFLGFSGHFSGYPILPAYVQVLTAWSLVEAYEDGTLELVSIEKAKFTKEIAPEQTITVVCQNRPDPAQTIFSVRVMLSGELAASFMLLFKKMENPNT